jgi:hypothetical protein
MTSIWVLNMYLLRSIRSERFPSLGFPTKYFLFLNLYQHVHPFYHG